MGHALHGTGAASDIAADAGYGPNHGSGPTLLEVRGLSVKFGGIAALGGIDVDIPRGAIVGVIGPNGAGKTTLFNVITGLIASDAGRISIEGAELSGRPPQAVARLGISRTFQNLGLYPEFTVLENMRLGGISGLRGGAVSAALRLPIVTRETRALTTRARAMLSEVGLAHLEDVRAGELPFGTMKRIELARALMSSPRLVLLDEPAGGLAHGEVDAFAALVRRLHRDHRLTVVLVEHHMRLVMGLCDHIVVLHLGRKLAEGTPLEVRNHPEVIAAYLGAAA